MKPLTTIFATIAFVLIAFPLIAAPTFAQSQTQGASGIGGSTLGGWGKIVQGITGDRTPNVAPPTGGLSGLFGGANQGGGSSPSLFGGLPNLIPGLNAGGNGGAAAGGQTDFLSRMNQQSKNAIDRTTQWAQQKKQEMSSKMFSGALDMFKPKSNQGIQGLTSGGGALDWLKPKSSLPLNQPPIRSAENYGQQPNVRY